MTKEETEWVKQGVRITTRDRGIFRGIIYMVWIYDDRVEFISERDKNSYELSMQEFVKTYKPLTDKE